MGAQDELDPGTDSPRIFVPPPLLTLAVLVAGLAIDGRLTDRPDVGPAIWLPAATLVGAGLFLIGAALGLFRKSGTRPEPWAPASTIVTGGVYRFTRNPMYLGMQLIYAGVALFFLSPAAGLLLMPLFLAFDLVIVRREEAYLTRRFGEGYLEFRRRTRRWL